MITVARIQAEVAKSFQVPLTTMTTRNGLNCREIAWPRQVAMYLAFELTNKPKTTIGRLFGKRDHSTVYHAIHAVNKRMERDKALCDQVEKIRETLFSPPVDNPPPVACSPVESLECPMAQRARQHWREREAEERRVSRAYSEIMRSIAYEPKVRDEDRVYRDPCIKCGTRSDIGCVHTRVAA